MSIGPTRPGRPRDPSRDAAILAATLDLLSEVGYEHVTVRAIAQRAGAGLATMYRRWPTKEELVVHAVGSYHDAAQQPRAGDDPAENLVALVSGLLGVLQGPRRRLIANLFGQLWDHPDLAEALRSKVVLPRLAAVADQLRSMPGVDPERVQSAAELAPSALFFQVLILGRQLSEQDVRCLIDTVVRCASPLDEYA